MDLSGLNEIFKIIANTLEISIDVVQANAPHYIKLYAKYDLIETLTVNIPIGILLGFILGVIILMLAILYSYENKITTLLCFMMSIIFTTCLLALPPILKYNISPEIYGMEQILKVLK